MAIDNDGLNSNVTQRVIKRIADLIANAEVDEITKRFRELGVPEHLIAATFTFDVTGKPLKDIFDWATKEWPRLKDREGGAPDILSVLSGRVSLRRALEWEND